MKSILWGIYIFTAGLMITGCGQTETTSKQQEKKSWWKEAVVYEIYPRSFNDSNGDGIGDLKGVRQKLDYLKSLGVDVIWLGPMYQSPNADNGYDISNYKRIMDEFGTMADFDSLLAGLHQRDMKLILDLVVNHTSDEHHWFQESKKSKDNPYRDFYIWKDPAANGGPPNNWVSYFSGSAWQLDKTTRQYYLHLFAKKQPDLNWDNPAVRDSVYSMMHFWLDKGVDGFRMDVVSLYSKDPDFPSFPPDFNGDFAHFYANGPREHEYLKEMNKRVLSQYDIMTVGEATGVKLDEAPLYVSPDRDELDMIFQFELMGIDHQPDNHLEHRNWKLPEFKQVMIKWDSAMTGKGWNSIFLGNHDNPRVVSRFGDDGQYRRESAKAFATFLMTMRGTPYIYQGDELGMTNAPFNTIDDFRDIAVFNKYEEVKEQGGDLDHLLEQARMFGRDNSRTPMQWSDQEYAGFTTHEPWIMVNPNYPTINAAKEDTVQQSVLNYYRKIVNYRKDHPGLVYGDFDVLDRPNEQIFAYLRNGDQNRFLVVMNFTGNEVNFTLPERARNQDWKVDIDSYSGTPSISNGTISLKPWQSVIFRDQ
ncbi:MAG: alpha-glucosidase [Balneolaceae bacterium]